MWYTCHSLLGTLDFQRNILYTFIAAWHFFSTKRVGKANGSECHQIFSLFLSSGISCEQIKLLKWWQLQPFTNQTWSSLWHSWLQLWSYWPIYVTYNHFFRPRRTPCPLLRGSQMGNGVNYDAFFHSGWRNTFPKQVWWIYAAWRTREIQDLRIYKNAKTSVSAPAELRNMVYTSCIHIATFQTCSPVQSAAKTPRKKLAPPIDKLQPWMPC